MFTLEQVELGLKGMSIPGEKIDSLLQKIRRKNPFQRISTDTLHTVCSFSDVDAFDLVERIKELASYKTETAGSEVLTFGKYAGLKLKEVVGLGSQGRYYINWILRQALDDNGNNYIEERFPSLFAEAKLIAKTYI